MIDLFKGINGDHQDDYRLLIGYITSRVCVTTHSLIFKLFLCKWWLSIFICSVTSYSLLVAAGLFMNISAVYFVIGLMAAVSAGAQLMEDASRGVCVCKCVWGTRCQLSLTWTLFIVSSWESEPPVIVSLSLSFRVSRPVDSAWVPLTVSCPKCLCRPSVFISTVSPTSDRVLSRPIRVLWGPHTLLHTPITARLLPGEVGRDFVRDRPSLQRTD